MSGGFHGAVPMTAYYIQAALLQGWTQWFTGTDGLDNFKSIFRGVHPSVLAEWHTALTERNPTDPTDEPLLQFRIHGQPGVPRFPGIVIVPEGESPSEDHLGDRNLIGGQWGDAFIGDEMVSIEVRAPGAEIALALTVVCRAILSSMRRALMSEGKFLDIHYVSRTGPTPDEAMLQEAILGAVSVQTLRYAVKLGYQLPMLSGDVPRTIDWVVQRTDIPIDDAGNLGGANALDQQ